MAGFALAQNTDLDMPNDNKKQKELPEPPEPAAYAPPATGAQAAYAPPARGPFAAAGAQPAEDPLNIPEFDFDSDPYLAHINAELDKIEAKFPDIAADEKIERNQADREAIELTRKTLALRI